MQKNIDSNLIPSPVRRDWKAHWIWAANHPTEQWRNSYAFFRKKFHGQGEAILHVATDTRYEIHLNGCRIGRGTAPCDVRYKPFDTYHVNLDPGEHILALLVHHVGETCATVMRSRPGVLVELEGDGFHVGSDASWKALLSKAHRADLPCMMSHFGFHIECDQRLIPHNWDSLLCDDSHWPCAQDLSGQQDLPWLALVARDCPALETTVLHAKTIMGLGTYEQGQPAQDQPQTAAVQMAARQHIYTQKDLLKWPVRLGRDNQAQFMVVDFGREVSGHVALRLSDVCDGARVELGYDEKLDEHGLPNPRRTYVHFADSYVLHQNQSLLEVFEARGFRYLMIDVAHAQQGLTIEEVNIEERLYPISKCGSFACSDAGLDTLYQVAQRTNRLCMLDNYVDCPSRERVLWMDMQIEGLTSAYSLGDTALWRHCLFLFAQNTIPNGQYAGAIKGYVPTDLTNAIDTYIMLYVACVKDYVRMSGDMQTGRALWPTVMRQFEILETFCQPGPLLSEDKSSNFWRFVDWSAMDIDATSASVNALYIQMHRDALELAAMIGLPGKAQGIASKLETLAEAFMEAFWSDAEKLFIDAVHEGIPSAIRSQASNLLAVCAGVIDGEAAQELMMRITDPTILLERTPGDYRLQPCFKPQVGGLVPVGTPAMGFQLLQALWKCGLDEQALNLLKHEWGRIAHDGTFAEHFIEDKNTSFCHGWSTAPGIVLPKYILGITPLTPGWTQVAIHPRPSGLSWARGSVITPHGEVHVEWSYKNGQLEIDAQAPPQISLVLPADCEVFSNGQ